MISSEDISTFQGVCGTDNDELSKHFLEMAGGDVETAISLFFEHGGERQLTGNNNSNSKIRSDGEIAEDLQRQTYQENDNYRAPDQARHETLVETNVFPSIYGGVGGSFQPLRNARDMFDQSRPSGIFNQHLEVDTLSNDDSEDDSEFTDQENYPDKDEQFEYVEETVVEIDNDGELREYTKMVRKPKPMSKETKLALLFRPPFNMMAKLDLDGARQRARKKQKWIMINIQASDIFQCQMLNRDLWSDSNLAAFIKKNFIFLQYQYDSRLAETYIQRYNLHNRDDCPHIAILDPMTGERLKQWNREVPKLSTFNEELAQFLDQFSLDPNTTNPTVKEPTPEIDPTTLSEEKQLELAIRESLGNTPSLSETSPTKADEAVPVTQTEHEDPHTTLFNSIKPVEHLEPDNKPGITTRIQVRTGDGKRLVRRFDAMNDTVRTIYEVIKSHWEEYSQQPFLLTTHTRENLIEKLDESINDAGLKNSSLLLEKIED